MCTVLADIGIGLISGYVGTKLMEPVGVKLYELESETDRQQEDRVRPGPPYQIAAERTAKLVGRAAAVARQGVEPRTVATRGIPDANSN